MVLRAAIGARDVELGLTALRYERPEATDYDDANWILGAVRLQVRGVAAFDARHTVSFRTEELTEFRDQLRHLAVTLSGEAHLEHMEENFGCTIRLTRGIGTLDAFVQQHTVARLAVTEAPIDQTQVAEALAGLEAIVDAFPVRRRP